MERYNVKPIIILIIGLVLILFGIGAFSLNSDSTSSIFGGLGSNLINSGIIIIIMELFVNRTERKEQIQKHEDLTKQNSQLKEQNRLLSTISEDLVRFRNTAILGDKFINFKLKDNAESVEDFIGGKDFYYVKTLNMEKEFIELIMLKNSDDIDRLKSIQDFSVILSNYWGDSIGAVFTASALLSELIVYFKKPSPDSHKKVLETFRDPLEKSINIVLDNPITCLEIKKNVLKNFNNIKISIETNTERSILFLSLIQSIIMNLGNFRNDKNNKINNFIKTCNIFDDSFIKNANTLLNPS
ncbi:MAG: hypothetical protein ACYCTB_11450 [bacterium]